MLGDKARLSENGRRKRSQRVTGIHSTVDGAIMVADSIQKAIRDLSIPHQKSKVSDVVTVSMGISCLIPTVDLSVEALIKITDDALYQAKQ